MTKLPAWRLARHAYLDVMGNLPGLLRVGGLWLLEGFELPAPPLLRWFRR